MTTHRTSERSGWMGGLTAIFRVESVVVVALALFAAKAHAAPTDAMLVYGDNTAGTPKYRIWDGSAWTQESNALSVGSAPINRVG